MGSRSDWETMQHAAAKLEALGVPHEVRVVSAHRTPDVLFDYAATAQSRGLRAIIAGAGGAAHLPGMLAAKTAVPVLGVPVQSKALNGMDSLLSIVQMPAGIPVATFAIGNAGAANAALFAAAMLAARASGDRRGARSLPHAPDRRRARQRRPAARHDHGRHPRRRATGPHARAFRRAARPALPGDGQRRRRLRRPVRADAGRRLSRRSRAGRVRLARRRGHVRLRERAGRIARSG